MAEGGEGKTPGTSQQVEEADFASQLESPYHSPVRDGAYRYTARTAS